MAVVPSNDPNFQAILPSMIDYAELRIQRDLDLFAGQTVNTSYLTSIGSATVTIQDADFITIQSVSLSPTSGLNTPLLPTTKEFLQYVYPVGSTSDVPQYFSMYSSNTVTTQGGGSSANPTTMSIRLGPIPNAVYPLTINGTLHTAALSASNTPTWISTYLPDLFIMASMVYVSAFQRNFGRVNDDPAMAQTYESQYMGLLNGAKTEEFRKRFQGSAWTSMSTSPVATPTR